MKLYLLIGVSILVVILLIIASLTNVVGYQTLQSTNQKIINEVINQKELLSKEKKTYDTTHGNPNHVWPFQKCDSQRTGRSKFDTSQNKGIEKWKCLLIEGSIWGSVTIDEDSIIYVGTLHEEFYAIYPNGTIKWKIDLEGYEYQAPAIAPDGTIYVGTTNLFYAFNPNGTTKWIFNINENFFCEPIIDSNGTVYTASENGIVYAINPDGTLKWSYNALDYIFCIALDKDENIYFCGSYSNLLTCLNPDGSVKWTYEKANMWAGPVIGDDGTIYIIPIYELIALNPDGTVKWRVDFSLDDYDWNGYPSIAPDGTIIISGESEYVTALDPSDGSIIWQYKLGKHKEMNGEVSDAAIGADGTIFVTYTMLETQGYMCALSPDGTLKWKTQITSDIYPYDSITIFSDPSIGKDGSVYITTWFDTAGSTTQGIMSYGYIHAFGSGDEKQVQIINPKGGYLYFNGKQGRKVPFQKTLIIGDLYINCNLTSPNDVKRITCILRSHHPETTCQVYEIGLDTQPPYELVIDASKFKYNFRFYTIQINIDYHGGCSTSDRIDFFFVRKLKLSRPIPSPSVEWKYNAGTAIGTSPSVSDTNIYFGCWNGDIICLKSDTGKLQWKYSAGDRISSTPLIVNSKVYVGSCNGKLYCLNAEIGDVIWTYSTLDSIEASPCYWNGYVFFGSNDYRIYCIDAETGDYIWSFPTEGDVETTPAIYDGKIYVSSTEDHFYCIDAITGEEIWKIKTDYYSSSAVVDDGKVYFGSRDRFLYCLNAINGENIWSYETGYVVSPPAVVNGRVYFSGLSYFCGEFAMVYCVDAENSKLLWSYKITCDREIRPIHPVSVFNGRIYGHYGDSYVYCHDAQTGEALWRFETDDPISNTPSYLNGFVYVYSEHWTLCCLKEL